MSHVARAERFAGLYRTAILLIIGASDHMIMGNAMLSVTGGKLT